MISVNFTDIMPHKRGQSQDSTCHGGVEASKSKGNGSSVLRGRQWVCLLIKEFQTLTATKSPPSMGKPLPPYFISISLVWFHFYKLLEQRDLNYRDTGTDGHGG